MSAKNLITVLAAMALSVASAAEKTPAQKAGDLVRHVKKGTSITVTAYKEKLHAFALNINSEPAVGPNYAEPEELRRAIDLDGSLESMMKNREQMIGSVYQLKRPLLLMTENQVLRREGQKK